jgi:hypothetical protein
MRHAVAHGALRRVSDSCATGLLTLRGAAESVPVRVVPAAFRLHQAAFGKDVNCRDSSLESRASPSGTCTPDSHPRRIHRFDQARRNAGHAFPFRKQSAHRVAPCCLRTLQHQLGMCALTQVNPTWRPADPISLSSHTRVIARSHATGGSESAGSIGGLPAFSTQVHLRRLRPAPGLPGRRQNAEPEASRLDRGPDPACRIPAAVLTRIKRTTGT